MVFALPRFCVPVSAVGRTKIMSSSNCPSCSGRFRLFQRKGNCNYCRGSFCNDCLVKEGKIKWCHTCRVLVRTPYDRDALLKLSVKDLRSYLQRKHVSTFGCSEKQDLVDLVYENFGRPAAARASSTDRSLPSRSADYPSSYNRRAHSSSRSARDRGHRDNDAFDADSSASSDEDSVEVTPVRTSAAASLDDGIRVRAAEDVAISSDDTRGSPESEGVAAASPEVHNHDMTDTTVNDNEPGRRNNRVIPDSDDVHMFDSQSVPDAGRPRDEPNVSSALPLQPAAHVHPPVVASSSSNVNAFVFSPSTLPENAGDAKPKLGRFPSVSDLRTLDDVDSLTVRECKELLALYRVDFKGACEKFELLAKVRALWLERQRAKAEASELPDDELCRICMDSKIDCVLLECGHMVTCTLCGKKMNECPICRQYVIRAVHVFRT